MSHLFDIAYSKESAVPSESAFAGRSGLNWGCDTQKLNWRWKKKEEEDANCKYVKTRGKSDTAITCWLFKFLFSINKRKGFKCYYVYAGGGGGDDGDGDGDDGRRWSIPHLHHLHQELPCLFPVDLSKRGTTASRTRSYIFIKDSSSMWSVERPWEEVHNPNALLF